MNPQLIPLDKCCTWDHMAEEDAVLAANEAYYRAFNDADIAAMGRVWAEDGASCIHPGWPALIGREAILQSYRGIFSNAARETIAHHDEQAMICGGEGRVLCVEIVSGATLALAATNLFRRIDGEWRMVHHHASPVASTLVGAAGGPPQRLN